MRFTRIAITSLLIFSPALALVFTACGGFSGDTDNTADAQSTVGADGSILDDSSNSTDSAASVGDAAQESSLTPVYFCRDSSEAGHYACLDFEDGGGRPQWAESNTVNVTGGPLEIVDAASYSPTHSAVVHANSYRVSPTEPNQRLWRISARVKPEDLVGGRLVLRASLNEGNIGLGLRLVSGVASPVCDGSGGLSHTCTFGVAIDGTFYLASLELTATPADGGFALNSRMEIGGASIQTRQGWTRAFNYPSVSFGSTAADGGVYFDDVVVDLVTDQNK